MSFWSQAAVKVALTRQNPRYCWVVMRTRTRIEPSLGGLGNIKTTTAMTTETVKMTLLGSIARLALASNQIALTAPQALKIVSTLIISKDQHLRKARTTAVNPATRTERST